MSGPRLYLAIDNCFAAKRWTEPLEWAQAIKNLGLDCVEASADNECDPLYADPDYLKDWLQAVKIARQRTGVKVVNLYSGHGTYASLGITSSDSRNRRRMVEQWLKVLIRNAAQLQAGVGFFCHAFDHQTLQHPDSFRKARLSLYDQLAEVAVYSADCGTTTAAIEQMYSPHQIPWTIQGARNLLREVWERDGKPFYITIDTGHQTGQRKFLRPGPPELLELLRAVRLNDKSLRGKWLGPDSAYALFRRAVCASPEDEDAYIRQIEAEMDRCAYLFAEPEDADLEAWLRQLGCYSPIIHLQQTNGTSSSHLPFTREMNERGIVRADKVLHAIRTAYAQDPEAGMPPRCEKIFLTLEIFPETTALPFDIASFLEESVAYWRKFVPRDGIRLDEVPEIERSSSGQKDFVRQ